MAPRAPGGAPPGRAAARRALVAALAAAAPALSGGGCAPLAATGSGGASASEAAAFAGRLPAVAAGFRRGETRPAAAGDAGSETAYATPGGRLTAAATVEVLADDAPAAAALDAMLAEALRPVPPREMRDAGRFSTVAGAGALQCARLEGRYGRERVAGLACAGRVGGALLRIRVTMPAREPPADPRAFAEAVAAALSGPAAPAG